MAYKISGRVLSLGPTQQLVSKSGTSYMKRDLVINVIKYDPYTGYPAEDPGNTPKFTFMGDKCHSLNDLQIGDTIVVHFDLSGRSYEKDGREEYLTDVRPFMVMKLRGSVVQASSRQPTATPPYQAVDPFAQSPFPPIGQTAPTSAPMAPQGDNDDLPF